MSARSVFHGSFLLRHFPADNLERCGLANGAPLLCARAPRHLRLDGLPGVPLHWLRSHFGRGDSHFLYSTCGSHRSLPGAPRICRPYVAR
eukprot:6828783-Pyramimonas_sp.AAC.1